MQTGKAEYVNATEAVWSVHLKHTSLLFPKLKHSNWCSETVERGEEGGGGFNADQCRFLAAYINMSD